MPTIACEWTDWWKAFQCPHALVMGENKSNFDNRYASPGEGLIFNIAFPSFKISSTEQSTFPHLRSFLLNQVCRAFCSCNFIFGSWPDSDHFSESRRKVSGSFWDEAIWAWKKSSRIILRFAWDITKSQHIQLKFYFRIFFFSVFQITNLNL